MLDLSSKWISQKIKKQSQNFSICSWINGTIFEKRRGCRMEADRRTRKERFQNMIRFLGGRSTLFVLVSILLIGLIILIFNWISFIFYPINSLFLNSCFASHSCHNCLLFTQTNFRLLEKIKIPRIWGIFIIFIGAIGLITLLSLHGISILEITVSQSCRRIPYIFQTTSVEN